MSKFRQPTGFPKLQRMRSYLSLDKLFFYLIAVFVIYLVISPLILLVLSSFKSTGDRLPTEAVPWTLANYSQVLQSPETYILFRNSLLYALCSVSGALAIAIPLVWLTERTDLPGKNLLFTLLLIPLAMPAMIKAIGWSFLASPSIGVVNVVTRSVFSMDTTTGPFNIYTLPGIIFVSILSLVPSIMLLIAGPFRSFDPSFEEASEVSGATRVQSQLKITLPLMRPALLASFVYFFAAALDDFQIPAILGLGAGIRVFSTKIYLATHPYDGLPDYGLASGYSMMLFLVALTLILSYRKVVKRQHMYAVITGKGYRPRIISLGKWKYVAFGGISLYLILAAVLPLLILLWISLQPYLNIPSFEGMAHLTGDHYRELLRLEQFRAATTNTVVVTLIVATATMFLSTVTAWMAVRGQFWGSSLPDTLTFLNTAVPSIVFGLALIFLYLSIPSVQIYGTIWIIIIAYITRYMSYSNRVMGAAVVQIHKELEEASASSGASQRTTFLRVTLPLLLPSFLNGWLWVAVHSLREGTISVILMTPFNVMLAALIWGMYQEGGQHGLVAAMSLAVTSASFLLTLIGRRALLVEHD